jgi:TP901 family phage tail tape measure protein
MPSTMEDIALLRVRVLGDEAEQSIDSLKGGLKDVNSEIKLMELNNQKGNKEWTEAKLLQREINSELKKMKSNVDITNASYNELVAHKRQLNTELNKLKIGSKEWIDKLQEIQPVNAKLSETREHIRGAGTEATGQQGLWAKYGTWIKGAFAFGGIMEAWNMLKGFGAGIIEEATKFESSTNSLRGEVTLTEEQFAKLKQTSKEAAEQFGMTGTEMVDAYNVIASGKSDLIEVEGGIQAVTDAAIRLATNGEMELKPAAEGLTESLNQFGAEASEAAKYVDIMSTGTQVGAGKIESITAALSYAGPMAKAAGLSFGETNAALQILEQNGIKAQKAGTGLRGVLANLLTSTDETNPAIVGMEKAMENLAAQNLTAAEYTALFGRENVSAGISLVENHKRLKEWTAQIEKGGGALDMYTEKTKGSAFEQKKSAAAYANSRQELGEKLLPAYTAVYKAVLSFVSGMVTMISTLGQVPAFIRENKELFIALGVALVSLNAANIAAAASAIYHVAAEKGRAIATKATATAQWLLNAAMTANPIGLLIAGIAALTGGLIYAYKNMEGFRNAVDAAWAMTKSFVGVINDLWVAFTTLNFKGFYEKLKSGFSDVANAGKAVYEKANAEGNKKVAADNKEHRDSEGEAEAKRRAEEAKAAAAAKEKELREAAAANKVHRDKEKENAAELAEKKAEKELEENEKLIDHIEELRIESIEDELERNKEKLRQKYKAELETIEKSMADIETKNELELKLKRKLISDIEKLEDDDEKERKKKEALRLKAIEDFNNKVEDWAFDSKKKIVENELKNENLTIAERLRLRRKMQDVLFEEELVRIDRWQKKEIEANGDTAEAVIAIMAKANTDKEIAAENNRIVLDGINGELVKNSKGAFDDIKNAWAIMMGKNKATAETSMQDSFQAISDFGANASGAFKSILEGNGQAMYESMSAMAGGMETKLGAALGTVGQIA